MVWLPMLFFVFTFANLLQFLQGLLLVMIFLKTFGFFYGAISYFVKFFLCQCNVKSSCNGTYLFKYFLLMLLFIFIFSDRDVFFTFS